MKHSFAMLTTVVLIFTLVFGSIVSANTSDSAVLSKPVECLVCGKLHDNARNQVNYKNIDIALCSDGCAHHYHTAEQNGKLDAITAKIEPRSMLFQEDSNSNRDLQKGFFWLGCYILIGLLCGGAAAYLAVQKGVNAWFGFMIGLIFNIFGFLIIVVTPKKDEMFQSQGLTKVPKTHDQNICSACGEAHHPAARKCLGCGRDFDTKVVSEVELVGLRKEGK